MEQDLVICIPGNWESREDFLKEIITSTKGEFMFAGAILAHPEGKDHVELEFYDAYEQMAEAFEYGGQGKISNTTLMDLNHHKSVAYLSNHTK